MHQPVVVVAEQEEVVDVGASALPPGDFVVEVAHVAGSVAGFPAAGLVPGAYRLVLPGGGQPPRPAHVEYFGVGPEDDAGQFGVAGESLCGGGRYRHRGELQLRWRGAWQAHECFEADGDVELWAAAT